MKHKVYIGFDPKEARAWDVARNSILSRTSSKVEIHVLDLGLLKEWRILDRPIEYRDGKMWCPISQAPMATEFAISRFAIPLINKKGWVLFCDCDIVCLADIAELFALADEKYAVMVVKHDHIPLSTTKMVDKQQTTYPRKNWSSVVLWNCGHPSNSKLTSEVLHTWPGRDLHAFKWLEDGEIGALPSEWNYLVGTHGDDHIPDATQKLLHFTLGGPWLTGWAGSNTDKIWLDEAKKYNL